MKKTKLEVVIVMGSKSDLKVMSETSNTLKEWGVSVETQIVSAHRTPDLLKSSVETWHESGVKIIIAGAGGAAHLPGMLAAISYLPVIGVPIKSKAMNGLDSLLSIAQMPKGVPVATVAIDNAMNAALLAIQILSLQEGKNGSRLREKLIKYKSKMKSMVSNQRRQIKKHGFEYFLK
jgi:5-(carboxyamino)imidazole ribonucleotide mutase